MTNKVSSVFSLNTGLTVNELSLTWNVFLNQDFVSTKNVKIFQKYLTVLELLSFQLLKVCFTDKEARQKNVGGEVIAYVW